MSVAVNDALADVLAGAKGFIFDMDGTLVLGDDASGGHRALPGAIELLDLLVERGIPYRVFTNGSAIPATRYAASLRGAGLAVPDEVMMTPSTSAAQWYLDKGISKVRALGRDGAFDPLRAVGIEVVENAAPAEGVEAVYVAYHRGFCFDDLEAACGDIWNGALLTTASDVPFFASKGGRKIGTSFAINASIEALTGEKPVILGKPAVDALHCAMGMMGLLPDESGQVVVVGDDPKLEMTMANRGGATGIGVATGLVSLEQFAALEGDQKPGHALSGVDQMLKAMR